MWQEWLDNEIPQFPHSSSNLHNSIEGQKQLVFIFMYHYVCARNPEIGKNME